MAPGGDQRIALDLGDDTEIGAGGGTIALAVRGCNVRTITLEAAPDDVTPTWQSILVVDLAQALSKRLREGDVLARLEGDRLVLLLTGAQLDNLFTLAEKLAAYASDDAAVRMTIGDAQAAGTIHLDDPRVADGLDLLASVNIIAPARIPEILAGTPPQ